MDNQDLLEDAIPTDPKGLAKLLEALRKPLQSATAELMELDVQLLLSITALKRVNEVVETARENLVDANANQRRVNKELLTPLDVLRALRISRGTLRRMCKDGRLPQPLKVSERKLAFRRSDIEQWIREGGFQG